MFEKLIPWFIGLMFTLALIGSCVSCQKKLPPPRIEPISLEKPCNDPPAELFGARLIGCEDKDGVLGCEYVSIMDIKELPYLYVCQYVLIRPICNAEWVLLTGQCGQVERKGDRNVKEDSI
jgi:hypothetical protein